MTVLTTKQANRLIASLGGKFSAEPWRGMYFDDAKELITKAIEQAGIDPAEVKPMGWNICHRVAQAAYKAGAAAIEAKRARKL